MILSKLLCRIVEFFIPYFFYKVIGQILYAWDARLSVEISWPTLIFHMMPSCAP
jgi:hypothetical protein